MTDSKIFPFNRENYFFILGGLIVIILGFATMSGGGSEDHNVFLGDYTLTSTSFEELDENFHFSPEVIALLKPLEGKVFPSEEELKTALMSSLGDQFESNYFAIRAATHIDADIFSFRRITLAPIIVLLGYILVAIGVMYRKNKPKATSIQPQLTD